MQINFNWLRSKHFLFWHSADATHYPLSLDKQQQEQQQQQQQQDEALMLFMWTSPAIILLFQPRCPLPMWDLQLKLDFWFKFLQMSSLRSESDAGGGGGSMIIN